MSRVKPSGQKHYEMLYIISNKFTEDEVDPIVEKIHKSITDKGGTITYTENWGKKKMAYQINGFGHGYYRLAEFDLDGEQLAEIERSFRLSNDIIRHQVVVKKIKSAEQIEKDKAINQKIAAKVAKAEAEQKEKEEQNKPKVAKAKPVKEAEETKVDLKDLDDKLDKILESGNLL
jgi:small subunit ribosomal protein S6